MSEEPDPEPNSNEESENQEGPTHIELVRVIDRTIHVSPIDREKQVDFTVRNPTDEQFEFLYLPLREFERNLEVYDEDGTRLNVYPNSVVEHILDQLKTEDEEGYKQMEHRFKHAEYKMFIQLPSERPIEPGSLRTIRLTFEESDPVEFYTISDPSILAGWLKNWEKKFFKIPSFRANAERFSGHPHDLFVVVVGTPGYAVTGDTKQNNGEPTKEIYENGLDDETRVTSCRLPPAKKRYSWTLDYDLVPNNHTLMKSLATYWFGAVILGIFSIVLPALGSGNILLTPEIVKQLSGTGQTVSAGFVTATLGLIFALSEDWTERYKLLSVIPLLLHGMAWVIWALVPSSPLS